MNNRLFYFPLRKGVLVFVFIFVFPVYDVFAESHSLLIDLPTSFLFLLKKGGYVMIPIFLCSIISFALVLERFLYLRRSKIFPRLMMKEIDSLNLSSDFSEIETICKKYDAPLTRIISAGFSRKELGLGEMEKAMIGCGQQESSILSRNLRGLGVIANLAPMLGLFGTVIGMISAFDVISKAGTGNPGLVAEGISQALFTTAAGLIVGIPSLAIYHFFRSRIDKIVFELESISINLINNLAKKIGQ